jgi:hypothetical protein
VNFEYAGSKLLAWLLQITDLNNNKKFFEELIAYFPWYVTDRIEIDSSNGKFFTLLLPSKDTRQTIIVVLRVYSLPREFVYWTVA